MMSPSRTQPGLGRSCTDVGLAGVTVKVMLIVNVDQRQDLEASTGNRTMVELGVVGVENTGDQSHRAVELGLRHHGEGISPTSISAKLVLHDRHLGEHDLRWLIDTRLPSTMNTTRCAPDDESAGIDLSIVVSKWEAFLLQAQELTHPLHISFTELLREFCDKAL